ncbi:MAG: OsmC family protein [Raineya sp.]|nr:OsmC family protein [Raineya sp.]
MKPQIESIYLGDLRTEATHIASKNKIITDAPTDNNGKGEAFSPTDLVCAALGSCMMTIMGIVAQRDNISLEGVTWKTTKIMASHPRRIAEIHVHFHFPANINLTSAQKQKLENAARTCPVALSLASEIKQEVSFEYE